MDLLKEILTVHSKSNTERIARLIADNNQFFNSLMKLVLNEDQEAARRAAWIMRSCYEHDPEIITPYIGNMINHLEKRKKIHDAVKRNILGILKTCPIPSKSSGKLLETCFRFVESGHESIAVKAFSMDIISALAAGNPDLLRELSLIIEDQMPYSSPGIKSKSQKILSKHHKS